MSRRIALLVLAASAALIATSASADPECFGETCRLPEVVDPPAAALQLPDADDAAAAEVSAAASKLARGEAPPRLAADPVVRPPVPMQNVADEASVPPLAPRPVKSLPLPLRVPIAVPPAPVPEANPAPVGYVRSGRVSSPDSTYVVGYNAAPAGGIVVVVPGAVYGNGRYMIAPSAKIISIDSDD
jgi:hypothetical protein